MTKRRRPGASKKLVEARFWGHVPDEAASGRSEESDEAAPDSGVVHAAGGATDPAVVGTPLPGIRPTPDPGALVRSLGPPPLAVDAEEAELHLFKVYRAAVQAATALAAVNGLLATDEPGA